MNPIVIAIIVALVLGIVFVLSLKGPDKLELRQAYLKNLAHFLESKVEPFDKYENSFKIVFNFEGRLFQFEDIEVKGFQEITHKVFIKTKIESDYTINFTEAPRGSIKSNIMVQASQITDQDVQKIVVPSKLKEFSITSNRIKTTNLLLGDYKIVDMFADFKNLKTGHPIIPLRVQDGEISLEFFPVVLMKPNIFDLQHGVANIEGYLEILNRLAKEIEVLYKKEQENI